jgi:putative ABC transport system substrate-binding protein
VSLVRNWNRPLLCALLVLVPGPVFAAGVLVLKGPNAAPYEEALSGLRQAYSGASEIDYTKRQEFLTRTQNDPPRLIVAIGRAAAEMAHQRVSTVPLFYIMVPNPADSGLAGKNIGGISMTVPGDVQLADFKQLLTGITKPVAVLYHPRSQALVTLAQAQAPKLDLQLELVPVESAEQVRLRISMLKPIIGAVWVIPDESFATEPGNKWFTFLLNETSDLHLPLFVTMNTGSTFVREGALAAVVSDPRGMGRQAGELIKQIDAGKVTLESIGAAPPKALDWEINLRTAEKIGVAVPQSVLHGARTYR